MKEMLRIIKIPVFCTVIGLIFGILMTLTIKPQWEAISIARVGLVKQVNFSESYPRGFTTLTPIESLAEFEARLRAPVTIESVLVESNGSITNEGVVNLKKETRISNVGDGLEIRVRAQTPERAVVLSQRYLLAIQQQHMNLLEGIGMPKDLSVPTRFTLQPSVLPEPVSPGRNIILFVSTMLGLGLGILLNMILGQKKPI